ncbi:hypothetical protein [Sphingomonas cavernae]|uniref:Uncharacterized protein n=1 Tax=Sphingomonas cavernae TaxID=2320861 RepID=A0A418WPK1_9SPHN|nr:hypothetical protein [Sphingomonas cavernae]RJF93134.1 hypothetical protein D3876_01840 [Sphingomonas cavernae]
MTREAMIQVIDEIVARPGAAKALLDDYLARYAPGARDRGMVLEQILVSPPMWLDDQSNTLTIRWSLRDTAAWWRMRAVGGNDPDVAAWWAEVDARAVSRRRSFAAEPADIGALCDV